jgi:glutamyl-tRNA reductase
MVYIIGTNHKYSDKNLRERLSFSDKEILNFFDFLKGSEICGCVILSTCNRIEIYFSSNSQNRIKKIMETFERIKKLEINKYYKYFYFLKGKEVLKHLSKVICGIDSLIVGETQIKKQVEDAYLISKFYGMIDKKLEFLFSNSFKISKFVRNNTKLNEGKVSVGSVTIDFLKREIGDFKDKKFVIIGCGKVSQILLNYLKDEGATFIFIGNRTYQKAKYLAEKFDGFAFKLDKLYDFLKICDVCISSTKSPHYIIKKEKFPEREKPIIIIDLALPRDVEPLIGNLENVKLYHLEDLNNIIEKNIEKRKKEAEKAKKIIDIYVDEIWKEFIELEQDQVILQ